MKQGAEIKNICKTCDKLLRFRPNHFSLISEILNRKNKSEHKFILTVNPLIDRNHICHVLFYDLNAFE